MSLGGHAAFIGLDGGKTLYNRIEWPDMRSLTILDLREIEQSAERGPVVRLRTLSRYDAVEE